MEIVRGVPTQPAVDRLMDCFGVPDEGDTIAWETLEGALGLGRDTCRFRTVVDAWRGKLFREHDVFLVAVGGGGGLLVAPPNRRIDAAARKVEQGRRAIERGILIATSTDRVRLEDGRRAAAANIASLSGAVFRLHARADRAPLPLPVGRGDRGYVPEAHAEGASA